MIPLRPATASRGTLTVGSRVENLRARSPLRRSQHSYLGVHASDRVERLEGAPRRLVLTLAREVSYEGEGGLGSGTLLAHTCYRDVVARERAGNCGQHAGLVGDRQDDVIASHGLLARPHAGAVSVARATRAASAIGHVSSDLDDVADHGGGGRRSP